MSDNATREMLAKTLEDFKISRSEKKALRPHVEQWRQQSNLSLIRNEAFQLAKDQLIDPDSKAVVDWLEDLTKILHAETNQSASPRSAVLFSPNDDCSTRIQTHIKMARKSLDICVFTITDNRISEEILDAHKRGVRVRIITDNDKANDLGSDIDQLANRGVDVRKDQTSFHMHHKFAIFDQAQLLTGSFNWTVSAAKNNEENLVITDDPDLIRQFAGEFDRLWKSLGV